VTQGDLRKNKFGGLRCDPRRTTAKTVFCFTRKNGGHKSLSPWQAGTITLAHGSMGARSKSVKDLLGGGRGEQKYNDVEFCGRRKMGGHLFRDSSNPTRSCRN